MKVTRLRFARRFPAVDRSLCQTGQMVNAGDPIATLDPGTDQVWRLLRALYLTGQPEDIPAIQPYERELPDIPGHVREQAVATEKAIRGKGEVELCPGAKKLNSLKAALRTASPPTSFSTSTVSTIAMHPRAAIEEASIRPF